MSKLKLGRIEDDKPVKLTIELRASTFRTLAEYARIHADATGLSEPLLPEKLIDPMLERFMGSDRVFGRTRGKSVGG